MKAVIFATLAVYAFICIGLLWNIEEQIGRLRRRPHIPPVVIDVEADQIAGHIQHFDQLRQSFFSHKILRLIG